jgi:hypothetical protein
MVDFSYYTIIFYTINVSGVYNFFVFLRKFPTSYSP